jgi:hypothetical protein
VGKRCRRQADVICSGRRELTADRAANGTYHLDLGKRAVTASWRSEALRYFFAGGYLEMNKLTVSSRLAFHVCPLCEKDKLRRSAHDSMCCDSCSGFLSGTSLCRLFSR